MGNNVMDSRINLEGVKGISLRFKDSKGNDIYRDIDIIKRLGAGASSVCYAVNVHKDGEYHSWILKQFYPDSERAILECAMEGDNSVISTNLILRIDNFSNDNLMEEDGKLAELIDLGNRFEDSFHLQNQLSNDPSLSGYIVKPIDDFFDGATKYVLYEADFGTHLDINSITTVEEFIHIMRGLAVALDRIHRKNIVYMDLKPENILVAGEGKEQRVKLFDFDAAIELDKINDVHLYNGDIRYDGSDKNLICPSIRRENLECFEYNKGISLDETIDLYPFGEMLASFFLGYYPSVDEINNLTVENEIRAKILESYNDSFTENETSLLLKVINSCINYNLTVKSYEKSSELLEDMIVLDNQLNKTIEERKREYKRANAIKKLMTVEPDGLGSSNDEETTYVKRSKKLERLYRFVNDNKLKNHIAIISGMGGLGKTELAKSYAYEYSSFVNKNKNNCHLYGKELFLTYNDECNTLLELIKNEKKYEGLADFIQEFDNDTLIIIDNYNVDLDNGKQFIRDVFFNNVEAHVLFTTRGEFSGELARNYKEYIFRMDEDVDSNSKGNEILDEIDVLFKIFENYYTLENEDGVISVVQDYEKELIYELCNLLQGNILAIKLLAIAVRESEDISIKDVYSRIGSTIHGLKSAAGILVDIDDYNHNGYDYDDDIYIVLKDIIYEYVMKISSKYLEKMDFVKALYLLSNAPVSGISGESLMLIIGTTPNKFEGIRKKLLRTGLISYEKNEEGLAGNNYGNYKMHPLISTFFNDDFSCNNLRFPEEIKSVMINDMLLGIFSIRLEEIQKYRFLCNEILETCDASNKEFILDGSTEIPMEYFYFLFEVVFSKIVLNKSLTLNGKSVGNIMPYVIYKKSSVVYGFQYLQDIEYQFISINNNLPLITNNADGSHTIIFPEDEVGSLYNVLVVNRSFDIAQEKVELLHIVFPSGGFVIDMPDKIEGVPICEIPTEWLKGDSYSYQWGKFSIAHLSDYIEVFKEKSFAHSIKTVDDEMFVPPSLKRIEKKAFANNGYLNMTLKKLNYKTYISEDAFLGNEHIWVEITQRDGTVQRKDYGEFAGYDLLYLGNQPESHREYIDEPSRIEDRQKFVNKEDIRGIIKREKANVMHFWHKYGNKGSLYNIERNILDLDIEEMTFEQIASKAVSFIQMIVFPKVIKRKLLNYVSKAFFRYIYFKYEEYNRKCYISMLYDSYYSIIESDLLDSMKTQTDIGEDNNIFYNLIVLYIRLLIGFEWGSCYLCNENEFNILFWDSFIINDSYKKCFYNGLSIRDICNILKIDCNDLDLSLYNKTKMRNIANNISVIEPYSFYGLAKGNLNLSNDVVEIREGAFCNCPKLKGKLVLPKGIKTIGAYSFYNCINLVGDLVIPDTVQVIEKGAFGNCGFNGRLSLPSTITEINDESFCYCSFEEGLVLPPSIVKIGDKAFYECKFGGSLVLPKGIKEIGIGAFKLCFFTGELILPDGIRRIGRKAFDVCNFSGELVLPLSLEYVGDGCFDGNNINTVIVLNKKIILDGTIIHKNILIKGYPYSTAEEYALKNGYRFEYINE